MLLRTIGLSKKFRRKSFEFYAVKNASITLKEGSFNFIVGRSGSGKTTFLNLISALLSPSEGEVLFEEKNITSMNDKEKSRYRNECISYVPQGIVSLSNLSVVDNIRLPFFLFDRDGDNEGRALSLLDMMGILHLKDESPTSLSAGEEKRMLIARSLMNRPRIMIADEPTANLDPETSKEVMHSIETVRRQGVTILIVTHDSSIITKEATVYKMEEGFLSLSR